MHGLLERDTALGRLAAAVERVRGSGAGEVATVSGEAGVGKTSVLRAFTGSARGVDVLWGACDGLRTPRPLGPLLDIVGAAGAAADREALLGALVARLSTPSQPAVVVVEDAHWADEATLDLLTLLGRRAPSLRALVVLSYRDDEVGGRHPLRVVLGDLAPVVRERIGLAPLSVDAVAALSRSAGADVDAAALHAATAGNPFFVTESLASGTVGVPQSVRDAVLARAARLGAGARRVLEAVAVVPGRAELALVEAVAGPDADALDECVERGVVVVDGAHAAMRHELARLAVVDAIPPTRRRGLHRRVLAALGDRDHAAAAFHAAECGDDDAVLHHASLAAERATAAGAHREAAAHLSDAAARSDRLPLDERAALHQRLAWERYVLGDTDGSIVAFDVALECRRALGDVVEEARLLLLRTAPLVTGGRQPEATASARRGLELLEPLGESDVLADAYGRYAALLMLDRQLEDAVELGDRAERMALALDLPAVVAQIRIQIGVAQLMAGDDAGLARIHRGMDGGREAGRADLVALGWSQIGSGGGEVHRYDIAIPALEACIAEADEQELLSSAQYARSWLARCYVDVGRWDEAAAVASPLLASLRTVGIARFTALNAIGRLRARRGDPDVWPVLDEALDLARQTQHLQRLWPVAASRAEAAWLEGRIDDELALVLEVHELAARLRYPWAVGELALWRWRAGVPVDVGDGGDPYALQVRGRFRQAADAWRLIGCPYEEASALADAGDVPSLRDALAIFESLGAAPAAARVARQLRAAGERVARGPNRSARANPAGMTDRELEVLALVAAGLSNRDVASRLGISVKTAGHHVSHILTKLGAASRAEAAVVAHKMGIAGVET